MQEYENVTSPVIPEVPTSNKIKRNKLFPIAEQVVHAYLEEGKTMREIAEFFTCSDGTVRNLLMIRGVDIRPRGRRKGMKVSESQGE